MSEPLVTIGMPVHNGAEHIAQAIDSLLRQTWTDFHLIICDNASTDSTPDICKVYAARDSRIRVVRNDRTISAIDNFVKAAERAQTPYFCWAAHDDLRHPQFLCTLVDLLDKRPAAGLATCACIEMDPDGYHRQRCAATDTLALVPVADACSRLVTYLRRSPCSAIYGLFRTDALKQHLNVLRHGPPFGADLVFLAAFVAHHDLAFAPAPMLLLRAGGGSHRLDQFRDALHLLRDLWTLHRALGRATDVYDSPAKQWRILLARWRLLARYCMWRPVRSMLLHHACVAMPTLAAIRDRLLVNHRALRRLHKRLRRLPRGSRIVLFGAGKHTRRFLGALQLTVRPGASIIAVCDDHAASLPPLPGNVPMIHADELDRDACDLVLVSSDTYERILCARAQSLFAPDIPVWCLYDPRWESCDETTPRLAESRERRRDYERSAAA